MSERPATADGGIRMAQTFFDDPRQLKIKDFVITDEFEMIEADRSIKEAIGMILAMTRGVLLVKEGAKDIKGVVTERKILKKIAGADKPMDLKVSDIMDTHILRIHYDDKITKALDEIEDKKPAAVIVVNKKGEFKGYFSPMDFLQAEKMIKETKKRLKDRETKKKEEEVEGAEEPEENTEE
jgi:predicted transcriptional regulator